MSGTVFVIKADVRADACAEDAKSKGFHVVHDFKKAAGRLPLQIVSLTPVGLWTCVDKDSAVLFDLILDQVQHHQWGVCHPR